MAGSGYVFRTVIKAERTARATSEISRKLKGITEQIDADLKSYNDDTPIYMRWSGDDVMDPTGTIVVDYDQHREGMMFFSANRTFTSYKDGVYQGNYISSSQARISYGLATNKAGQVPQSQEPSDRILARVQHVILDSGPPLDTSGTAMDVFPDFAPFDAADFYINERDLEYDTISPSLWDSVDHRYIEEMMTIITGVQFDYVDDDADDTTVDVGGVLNNSGNPIGPEVDLSDPSSLHKLFCDGVSEFRMHFWRVSMGRWWPLADPDGNGNITDSDYPFVNGNPANGLRPNTNYYFQWPGDGTFLDEFKAIKFTFTLYDSYGVFEDGKTFTHIVYLD